MDLASKIGYVRTFLVLGRASNLPTVWSNCLAGWVLAGAGEGKRLILLCLGSTFLYLGGMFLNDAFDAQFDQQHRQERPIPSGAVRASLVWKWGLSWLLLGVIVLGLFGRTTMILAILLALTILIYDAIHKVFAFSPVLMAVCRFFLVLVAASSASDGVVGYSIWSGLVLAGYIFGLSYVARRESIRSRLRAWPCFFLGAPVLLALVVNQGAFQRRGFLLSSLFVIWTLVALRQIFWSPQPNVGRTVSGLLAGIILVDFLAVGGGWPWPGAAFGGLFLLALLFQRFIPAT